MSVCSCVNSNIYNGFVTTDPLCPVHGEKAAVACSYPLCPIHFPPNRAPLVLFSYFNPILQMGLEKFADAAAAAAGADILRALKEPTHWKTQDELAERLNALICTLLADAQEEMRERCAKVADAFEAAYSTGARAVLKRIAEDIRALPLAGADALKPQDSQEREET